MNEQINLRLPQKLLKDARQKAKSEGYGTVQAYIEQAVREDVYDDFELTPKEAELIGRLKRATDEKKLWLTETEFRKKVAELRQKKLSGTGRKSSGK